MATLKVIALIGQAGSGKSEVAQHLVANHRFTRVGFADILKDMLGRLGLSVFETNGHLKEEPCSLLLGQTPRHAMQTLGTEWGRDLIHPDLWVHAWKVRVVKEINYGYNVVADDCRFMNEANTAAMFHPSGIWRILRKGIHQGNHDLWRKHSSEQESDRIHVDRTIKNYGSIGDLKTAVDSILANYDPSH